MCKFFLLVLLVGFRTFCEGTAIGNFLEEKVRQDLTYCNISTRFEQKGDCLDVAIIGAGHAGKGLCLALQKHGICNTAIFESAPKGEESIWLTVARMNTLRSGKDCVGPALTFAHLTFRAWYEAQGGNWDGIEKVPTQLWGRYLLWFGETLGLPIFYEWRLEKIVEGDGTGVELIFDRGRKVRAKKVILATGRKGFGGPSIPPIAEPLPKSCWQHTSERIDPSVYAGKKVCIIGAASSAFDLAATAIENGALQVDMLMRREKVKPLNYLAQTFSDWLAYFYLPDEEKISLIHNAYQHGFCPPSEAVQRATSYGDFHLHPNIVVDRLDEGIKVSTNQGEFQADLLFFATGFKCDPFLVAEMGSFVDKILLWRDVIPGMPDYLGLFPYLGKSFELQEKMMGSAPFLKNIHCFNFGSYLSHGNTGIDVDQFHIGAERIAEGIAIDLALERYRSKSAP